MMLVRDTPEGHTLRAFCETVLPSGRPCGHWSVLSVDDLVAGWGEDLDAARLRRMLKCTRCGTKGGMTVQLHPVGDRGWPGYHAGLKFTYADLPADGRHRSRS